MNAYKNYLLKTEPKRKFDPNLKRDLTAGWLFPYLVRSDAVLDNNRWRFWFDLQIIPISAKELLRESDPNLRLELINDRLLKDKAIPQLNFSTNNSQAIKMLRICLDAINTKGFNSLYRRLEFLTDWLLWALGHPGFTQPKELPGAEGSAIALYQLFNLNYLLAFPGEYFGCILSEALGKSSRSNTGFFPTPIQVSNLINKIIIADDNKKIATGVLEPTVGVGNLLLSASNHTICAVGVDINLLALKCCLVNMYLYAPWFCRPVFYLLDYVDLIHGNELRGEYYRSLIRVPFIEIYKSKSQLLKFDSKTFILDYLDELEFQIPQNKPKVNKNSSNLKNQSSGARKIKKKRKKLKGQPLF